MAFTLGMSPNCNKFIAS